MSVVCSMRPFVALKKVANKDAKTFLRWALFTPNAQVFPKMYGLFAGKRARA
jgi:hypothetical protein